MVIIIIVYTMVLVFSYHIYVCRITTYHINNTRMNAPYDFNLLIEVLFDQVKDGMDYADARNHPKTPE